MASKYKPFTPSDVIASLLTFLPDEFNNDPKKIHSTIERLQRQKKYKHLLEDFEFLNYDPYPYSPLLGRILNRLQEARLLSSLNPEYEKYVLKKESREAIKKNILKKKLSDQAENLQQMASELKMALK
ncbi:MAG: hypothetical protein FJ004_07735 [Chloroflexi bacterium]|nr:hypothetical protein [Chloroflexota bacterium]